MKNILNILKKPWLWIILVLVILGVWVVPGMVFKSEAMHQWVKAQMEEQSGGKFEFSDISVSLFSAKLKDVRLDLSGKKFNVHLVQAKRVKASFQWMPLLQGKLYLNGLKLYEADLKYQFRGTTDREMGLPLSKKIQFKNSSFSFQNLNGWGLNFKNANLTITDKTEAGNVLLVGSMRKAEGTAGQIGMREMGCHFEMTNKMISIKSLEAQLASHSTLMLKGSQEFSGTKITKMTGKVRSYDVRKLLQVLRYGDQFGGTAEVEFQLGGILQPNYFNLQGKGTANLVKIDSTLETPNYPTFNNAAILQKARNLKKLKGESKFNFRESLIEIEKLSAQEGGLRVEGTGVVGFDRLVDMNMRCLASPELAESIPVVVRNEFKRNQKGEAIIPFELKGDVRRVKVQMDSMVSKALLSPLKAINPLNLFKKRDKKKVEEVE